MNKYKIKDLLTLQRGFDITKKEQKDGIYPVVSSSGINSFHSEFMVKGPGVVIGRKGTLGTAFYIEGDFWPHDTTLWVKDFKGNNPYYIYCLLKSLHLEKLDSGSANPTLNRNYVHEISVSSVGIGQQKSIEQIVSAIDRKIHNNLLICFELESMAKTLYDYWFVQFDFPNENGNPYRSSGGEMEWNAQLKRKIPKGWEVTNIGNLTTVVTGKEDANFSSPNGKYKFFTCSQEALLCDTPAFSGQAVLIAGNGDFNVKHYSGEFNAYQRTYVLIPENQMYYGAMYISAKNQIQAFKNGSNGSIVKFITKGDVENIPFILPNDDSIFHQINKLIEKIELCERENEELTKLRDWLLPMLMNGQARVE